jgi:hypothetical protein
MKHVSLEGLKWFQDARFGMFIHWGLYSILARGEWVMHHEKIPVPEYEPLMQQFNPEKFNADEWVSIAADAGQKYIVITSRHHDGFSMYDTALSDYKVTRTPFRRDPLRELADACARRGDIKLGFYSSLLDWHHPAYRFRKESGLAWDDYLEFLHGQVRELWMRRHRLCGLMAIGPHAGTRAVVLFAGRLVRVRHALQPDPHVATRCGRTQQSPRGTAAGGGYSGFRAGLARYKYNRFQLDDDLQLSTRSVLDD